MKGNPTMETRTYLINTVWDYFNKELKQVDGNEVTIQFKVMDKYTMIEIIGIKKVLVNNLRFKSYAIKIKI